MKRLRRWWLLFAAVAVAVAAVYWRLAVPAQRVDVRSELVMLGDLDGDGLWTDKDLRALDAVLEAPFFVPAELAAKVDLNQSASIDEEDVRLLGRLVEAGGDPYAAEAAARAAGEPFPRPRELFRFGPVAAYRARPLWALPYAPPGGAALPWLFAPTPTGLKESPYARALEAALFSEAVRLDTVYRLRADGLSALERDYASAKLERAQELARDGKRFELYLALVELVEDAETLVAGDPSHPSVRLLVHRDHLRELLGSPVFEAFATGKTDWRPVFAALEAHLRSDLGMDLSLERLGPPRDFTHLQNYLDRAEWQVAKSRTSGAELEALVAYAQNDPRYLRAVARTSPKRTDALLLNHNLPMVLLFREALRITGGDKKHAVGLIDEAVRIPFAWIDALPRAALPSSVALESFLLPGNKEDGADKSRHWNVFGGICLYKSPQEAVELALRRELRDFEREGSTPDALREVLRDMIANLNGMFHVLSVDAGLLGRLGAGVRQAGGAQPPS